MSDQQRYWQGIRDTLLSARHEALCQALEAASNTNRVMAVTWSGIAWQLFDTYQRIGQATRDPSLADALLRGGTGAVVAAEPTPEADEDSSCGTG